MREKETETLFRGLSCPLNPPPYGWADGVTYHRGDKSCIYMDYLRGDKFV